MVSKDLQSWRSTTVHWLNYGVEVQEERKDSVKGWKHSREGPWWKVSLVSMNSRTESQTKIPLGLVLFSKELEDVRVNGCYEFFWTDSHQKRNWKRSWTGLLVSRKNKGVVTWNNTVMRLTHWVRGTVLTKVRGKVSDIFPVTGGVLMGL